MFEKLNDQQFEYILNILIEYKKNNHNKKVTISEKSFKEAQSYFMKCELLNDK